MDVLCQKDQPTSYRPSELVFLGIEIEYGLLQGPSSSLNKHGSCKSRGLAPTISTSPCNEQILEHVFISPNLKAVYQNSTSSQSFCRIPLIMRRFLSVLLFMRAAFASSCDAEPLVLPLRDVQVLGDNKQSLMRGIPAEVGTPPQKIVLLPWAYVLPDYYCTRLTLTAI